MGVAEQAARGRRSKLHESAERVAAPLSGGSRVLWHPAAMGGEQKGWGVDEVLPSEEGMDGLAGGAEGDRAEMLRPLRERAASEGVDSWAYTSG